MGKFGWEEKFSNFSVGGGPNPKCHYDPFGKICSTPTLFWKNLKHPMYSQKANFTGLLKNFHQNVSILKISMIFWEKIVLFIGYPPLYNASYLGVLSPIFPIAKGVVPPCCQKGLVTYLGHRCRFHSRLPPQWPEVLGDLILLGRLKTPPHTIKPEPFCQN